MKPNRSPITLIISLLILSFAFNNTYAQSQNIKPKLGLVLSGGGSKGLAHIGLLRMIDSLGIEPDYITGTSMGAIMGALYSIGYSGDELKQLALTTNWTSLLSNKLPLNDINIEEKDEYGRYLLELPLIHWKPTLPIGFIEGQLLQEFLISLTFPARHIQQFDSLPIPFHCVATDIKTGKAILLIQGSLSEAIRASMAAPLFFTPVEEDTTLLVDGGLVRNFPVREVIDMGATKVIGSYTGFRLMEPDELSDGVKMIYQSISLALTNVLKSDKTLCDVLIDNELQGLYSTNFNNTRAIIEAGEANARKMLPELIRIANWQKAQGIRHTRRKLNSETKLYPVHALEIHPDNLRSDILLRRKFAINKNQLYTAKDICDGLNQLYGTRFFDKIYLNIKPAADGLGSDISLHALESAKYVIKFGIHYDTDDAAGILINGTFRNVLLQNSRTILSLDLAENPKGHFNFYQFIGSKAKLLWTLDFIGERTVRNDFLFIKASNGLLKSKDKFLSDYFEGSAGFQFIMSRNTMGFFKFITMHELIKPQRDPRFIPVPNQLSFLKNESQGHGFVLGMQNNTLNSAFFASKGNLFRCEIKSGFSHYSNYTSYQYFDSIKTGIEKEITAAPNQEYIRYRIDEQKLLQLNNKLSLGFQASLGAGFSLSEISPSSLPSTINLDNPETFYIGGNDPRVRENILPFIGLRKGEVEFSQYLRFGIHLQYQLSKRIFITPSINAGKFTDNHKLLYKNMLDWDFSRDIHDSIGINSSQPTQILGYGLNLGYQSKIGPINLLVHSNTFTHSWYVFFSFGYMMP